MWVFEAYMQYLILIIIDFCNSYRNGNLKDVSIALKLKGNCSIWLQADTIERFGVSKTMTICRKYQISHHYFSAKRTVGGDSDYLYTLSLRMRLSWYPKVNFLSSNKLEKLRQLWPLNQANKSWGIFGSLLNNDSINATILNDKAAKTS